MMTTPVTIGIHTLGCKVNQYESERLCRQLRALGLDAAPGRRQAALHVINTCTVTAVADAKCRKLLSRLHRDNPTAALVVTGCMAELQQARVAALPGVAAVLGNREKEALAETVARLAGRSEPPLPYLPSRCRAFLKVQDGCDNFCAYCAVPYARPGMRSRPVTEIVRELQTLVGEGIQEVVVCGIRLGAYASDGCDLGGLLDALAATGVPRLRLSSLEPWDISPGLVTALARNPALCPHLHLPAQSGDDGVLQAMGRRNTARDYRRLVADLRAARPGLALSTDLLVGFPGETDQAFHNTMDLAREVGFCRLHVFRYSPRPGTRAASMPGRVPEPVKAARSAALIALGQSLAADFAARRVGTLAEVLVESCHAGRCVGHAPDYLQVDFPGGPDLVGRIVSVEITAVTGQRARGRRAKVRSNA